MSWLPASTVMDPASVPFTFRPLANAMSPPIEPRRSPKDSTEIESFANISIAAVDCTCTPSATAAIVPALCMSTCAPVI